MSRDRITREQQRARDAATQVQQVAGSAAGSREYSTLVHSVPVWIRTNGLLQTVVFLESKTEKPRDSHGLVLGHLRAHLEASGLNVREGALSRSLFDLPYDEYARWQEEAVRCAAWLKRFAAAMIEPSARSGVASVGPEAARG